MVSLAHNLLPCCSSAQAPHIQSQNCYGGTGIENALGASRFTGDSHLLIQTSDGGFFFLVAAQSLDSDITCNHRKGVADIWAVKLSSKLEIQWQRCIGGSGTDVPYSANQTTDRGFIIAAHTGSDDGDVTDSGGYYQWLHSFVDGWAVKLDSNGMIQWDSRIGGTNDDFLFSICQTQDGGYIGAGYTWSNDEYFRGQSWVSHGEADAFIVRLDAKGKVKWEKLYGGSTLDAAYSILQTSDGGFIFAGGSQSRDGDVQGVHGDTTLDPFFRFQSDVWVVRLDSLGKLLWQKCYGSYGFDGANSIISSGDGGFIIGAITDSADGDVSKHYWNSDPDKEAYDIWILKIDSVGHLLWEKTFGGTENEGLGPIIHTVDGGYVFCGNTFSSDGDVTKLYLKGPDIWIGGLSSSGDLLWQETLGGTDIDYANSIIQTRDGGFALYGTTRSNDGDVSGNHGMSDAWIAKLSAAGSGVESGKGGSNFAYPYPNPTDKEMRLELYHSSSVREVHYYNLMGVEFFPDHRIEDTTLVTDMQKLPSGIYVVRIIFTDPKVVEETRKFIRVE
jgi:hypothetical protein